MPNFSREDLTTRYTVFDRFALDDQRNYYKFRKEEYRLASVQVNRFKALFSALTGISAALAVFVLTVGGFTGNGVCSEVTRPDSCLGPQAFASFLAICSIVLPGIASFFSMLADLFQWDKFSDIYESAANNLERADAQLTDPDMIPDETFFRAAYTAYVSGTLEVMSSETSQWGQVSNTVPSIESFIEAQRQKDERNRNRFNPNAQAAASSAPSINPADLPSSAG